VVGIGDQELGFQIRAIAIITRCSLVPPARLIARDDVGSTRTSRVVGRRSRTCG